MTKRAKTKVISKTVGFSIVGFVLWFWDELLFVAPIAAVTAALGPLQAWAIMATVYFLGFFALSLVTLKRFQQKRHSRLSMWIEKQLKSSRKSRFYHIIKTGTWAAFLGSCFFLGGLITSHLVYRSHLWPQKTPTQIAFLCNFWFAVLWVGFYSGAFGTIFYFLSMIIKA